MDSSRPVAPGFSLFWTRQTVPSIGFSLISVTLADRRSTHPALHPDSDMDRTLCEAVETEVDELAHDCAHKVYPEGFPADGGLTMRRQRIVKRVFDQFVGPIRVVVTTYALGGSVEECNTNAERLRPLAYPHYDADVDYLIRGLRLHSRILTVDELVNSATGPSPVLALKAPWTV